MCDDIITCETIRQTCETIVIGRALQARRSQSFSLWFYLLSSSKLNRTIFRRVPLFLVRWEFFPIFPIALRQRLDFKIHRKLQANADDVMGSVRLQYEIDSQIAVSVWTPGTQRVLKLDNQSRFNILKNASIG